MLDLRVSRIETLFFLCVISQMCHLIDMEMTDGEDSSVLFDWNLAIHELIMYERVFDILILTLIANHHIKVIGDVNEICF